MRYLQPITTALLFIATPCFAQTSVPAFDQSAQQILSDHYKKYKDLEYFSGAALSIAIPGQAIKNYYIGQVAQAANSQPISANTLFQIGSITKSFTAAVALQLEKEKKLTLQDSLTTWLPQYSKWSGTTIKSMLNMTSGLPNYSDTPAWNYEESQDLAHIWDNSQLVNFAYPPGTFTPPLKNGYFYSNTGYVLLAMIVEKTTGQSFKDELIKRTINRAQLTNTFYPDDHLDTHIKARLAHGYNYNGYDNPMLVGRDMHDTNLTWAGAAGAIISNSEDVIKWVRALFVGNTVLDAKQKIALTQLISIKTGEPITTTTAADPRGFALGVSAAYDKEMGHFWFYEGMTLGYRALYMYIPCNGLIISSIFNSAVNSENDHAGALMKEIFKLVMINNPTLVCKTGPHDFNKLTR